MKTILFTIIIACFSLSGYSANEKDFIERLNRLSTIVPIEFSHDLNYQNKVAGLKHLDDLINHDPTTLAYFGRDKIVKKVFITDENYDNEQNLSLRSHTLNYLCDGSYNEALIKTKLYAFSEELRGISVMQALLLSTQKNIRFERGGDYELASKNNLYSQFLYELLTMFKNLQNGDLANKFQELDEIVILDRQKPSERTNMVYEQYPTYSNPQKIFKTLTVYFQIGYYQSSLTENFNGHLQSLMDIMFKYEFKTIRLFEHNESLAISGIINLASILNQNPEYALLLKTKGVKSFYLNSMWNEMGDIISSDGMLTVGLTEEDIRQAIDLFLL